jgi:two-component system, cell cycle sensor histidine kinase and response regulator CckA
LEKAINLTSSKVGFIGLISDDETSMDLLTYSEDVTKNCGVKDSSIHYPIETAGVWGDAIRFRRPVVINDFSVDIPSRKGYPEGHVPMKRFVCVPIFIENKIVMLAAMGDKDSDYDESDIRQLTLLGTGAWRIMRKLQTENSLKQSELKYRTLFENSIDTVFVTAEDGILLDINQAGLDLFGYSKAEMIGVDVRHLYFNNKDRERLALDIIKKGYLQNYEMTLKRKNGEAISCLITAVVRYTPDGKTRLFQGFIRDKTEMNKLEKQLLQAQKMESVGRLAGGVAHDFNNLLTAIAGNTELLLLSVREQDPLRDGLMEIQSAAEKATILTRQLLAFSRKQTLQPKVLNLNYVISNMEKMLRRIIGEDISLATSGVENLWRVKLDPNQVEQIIINLAVNARDAMPTGGKLTIETENVELDENYSRNHPGINAGKYVMIGVSDSGMGMTAEVKERIFDPFFTTKEPGKGTGLGLSTVYGIVKQSGGSIYVYSEPQKGTSFKIYFPIVEQEELDEIESKYIPENIPGGTERIMVAEDDAIVRSMACRSLKMQGYEVFEAQTGADAYMLTQKLEGKIDLLLTDIIMPNMSGTELAKLMVGLNPNIKVLYMSGYTPNAIVHDGILDKGVAYIQKPFRPKALAIKIREILDKSPEKE